MREIGLTDKSRRVERMFGRIVARYDLMNTLMTGGRDRSWRRLAVQMAEPRGAVALDVGTGTAELALELLRQGARTVVGLDFSQEMLLAARAKCRRCLGKDRDVTTETRRSEEEAERFRGFVPTPGRLWRSVPGRPHAAKGSATGRCGGLPTPSESRTIGTSPQAPGLPQFLAGDALNLPFGEGSFDIVISGFVVRNLADIKRGFQEMRRVLRPGGRVVCLEITHPRPGIFASLFQMYFYRLVPLLGSIVARDFDAYRYLPNSLTTFPAADGLARIMEDAGLEDVSYQMLFPGAVAIHRGRRG